MLEETKDSSHFKPYSLNGTLYAVRVYAASWGTIGGAVTDDTLHVIANDRDNNNKAGQCKSCTGCFL